MKKLPVMRCLAFVCLLPALSNPASGEDAAAPSSNTSPIRVAVFDDAGVSNKVEGLIELLNTFSELRVTKLDGSQIRGGKLVDCDVVLVPGGSGSKEAAALEESGRQEIRSFVERGGGYLGIC